MAEGKTPVVIVDSCSTLNDPPEVVPELAAFEGWPKIEVVEPEPDGFAPNVNVFELEDELAPKLKLPVLLDPKGPPPLADPAIGESLVKSTYATLEFDAILRFDLSFVADESALPKKLDQFLLHP